LEWQGDILAGRRIVNAHKKKVGNKIIGFDEKSDSHGTLVHLLWAINSEYILCEK
jgi:hypothetical protein